MRCMQLRLLYVEFKYRKVCAECAGPECARPGLDLSRDVGYSCNEKIDIGADGASTLCR